MRGVATFVAQVLVSFFVTGAVLPLLLFNAPALREGRNGAATIAACLIVSFAVLRFLWPKARRRRQE